MSVSRKWIFPAASVAVVAIIAGLLWYTLRPEGLGDGFASGNGRIEATDVDAASKLPGRIASIEVEEGEFVEAGQVIARMDNQVLEAQLAQATVASWSGRVFARCDTTRGGSGLRWWSLHTWRQRRAPLSPLRSPSMWLATEYQPTPSSPWARSM